MKASRKSVLGIVFLTVFLDIVGFSVIFPLFPSMLDHYVGLEGQNSIVGRLAFNLDQFSGGDRNATITLFGGILGSIYGLLLFLSSALWGNLSDRWGRRPVLLLTLTGTAAACLLWSFSGTFLTLVVARILGGAMAGNISVASAAVADSTPKDERAGGMGIVGMAIGLGFICGPALGGAVPLINPIGDAVPKHLALNPFSFAALASFLLALINLTWAIFRFPETCPRDTHEPKKHSSFNPFARLRTLKVLGLQRVNLVYFLYLLAFAGAEFTLTFLAVERLEFSRTDLAWMFVAVGLVIALVQGGLVRKIAPKVGERFLAQAGLLLTIPGFLFIAGAETATALYAGLIFMAVGSAFAMPCFSALASLYAPDENQGLALGAFRSMGSLARATGPVLGALLYWKWGSGSPFFSGAAFLALPLGLSLALPRPNTATLHSQKEQSP